MKPEHAIKLAQCIVRLCGTAEGRAAINNAIAKLTPDEINQVMAHIPDGIPTFE